MKKQALLFLLAAMSLTTLRTEAQVSVGVSIRIGPPAIPVYTQPPCPYDGYLWVPGFWAYGDDGYYWVPGYWIAPPTVGYLWTPGYWGYDGGLYLWHAGYWGPHVGFYGGVNYGFGYGGVGFVGGRWAGGHFQYNTAIVNVNRTVVHNTYIDRTVVRTTTTSRASFNGPGGVTARPTAQEEAAMHEHHIQRTSAQVTHQQTASRDRSGFASVNHGTPSHTAVSRPMTHSTTTTHATTTRTTTVNRSVATNSYHSQQPHNQPQHVQTQHSQPQHMEQRPQEQHMQEHAQQPHAQPQPHPAPRPEGGGREPEHEHHR